MVLSVRLRYKPKCATALGSPLPVLFRTIALPLTAMFTRTVSGNYCGKFATANNTPPPHIVPGSNGVGCGTQSQAHLDTVWA